jgi:hypothetical protein
MVSCHHPESGRLHDDEGLYEVDFLLKERSNSHAASSTSRSQSCWSSSWDEESTTTKGQGISSSGQGREEPVDTAGLAVGGSGVLRAHWVIETEKELSPTWTRLWPENQLPDDWSWSTLQT